MPKLSRTVGTPPGLYTKAQTAWRNMCKRAAAKKIYIEPAWTKKHTGEGFRAFLADVGPPPTATYSLRMNRQKLGYRKDNVAWRPEKRLDTATNPNRREFLRKAAELYKSHAREFDALCHKYGYKPEDDNLPNFTERAEKVVSGEWDSTLDGVKPGAPAPEDHPVHGVYTGEYNKPVVSKYDGRMAKYEKSLVSGSLTPTPEELHGERCKPIMVPRPPKALLVDVAFSGLVEEDPQAGTGGRAKYSIPPKYEEFPSPLELENGTEDYVQKYIDRLDKIREALTGLVGEHEGDMSGRLFTEGDGARLYELRERKVELEQLRKELSQQMHAANADLRKYGYYEENRLKYTARLDKLREQDKLRIAENSEVAAEINKLDHMQRNVRTQWMYINDTELDQLRADLVAILRRKQYEAQEQERDKAREEEARRRYEIKAMPVPEDDIKPIPGISREEQLALMAEWADEEDE